MVVITLVSPPPLSIDPSSPFHLHLNKVITYLLYDRENPWLVIVIAVRADAQVDFLGEWVDFVRGGELENAATVIGW